MAGPWDTPPTGDEIKNAGVWDTPPSPEELGHAPKAHEGPGAGEALFRGAVQGTTMGFGDELAAGLAAVPMQLYRKYLGATGVHLTPQALAEAHAAGIADPKQDDPGLLDEYRGMRDQERAKNAAAADAHSGMYLAGNVAGGLLTAPLMPGGAAKGLGGAVAQGVGMGAANGLGSSNADLTRGDVGGAAVDTALGGGMGGVAGAGGYGAGKLLAKVPGALQSIGISQGRRAITGGANTLSTKADLPDAAVKEALDMGLVKPGDNVKRIAERLQLARKALGQKYGETVGDLVDAGVEGPAPGALREQWVNKAGDLEANTLGSNVPEMYKGLAEEIAKKPTLESGNLDLRQAERMKQALQEKARSEYTKIGGDTLAGNAKMDQASDLRQLIEDTIHKAGETSNDQEVKDLAAQFVPVKRQLGNVITADTAAAKGAAQAEKRANFGLRDVILGAPVLGAGMSTGNPMLLAKGAAMVGATHLLRTRGPATAAAGAYSLGKLMDRVVSNPASLGPYGAVLSSAMQRGGQNAVHTTHFVLSQTDPAYQQHLDSLPDDEQTP
jgi:hypothetical protein